MAECSKSAHKPAIACALHHYVFLHHRDKAVIRLSENECLKAFHSWVCSIRVKATEIPAAERLMCPMLWCRDAFQDEDSMLRHVISCPWMTDTWYWCSFCRRPESYVNQGAPAVKLSERSLNDNGPNLRDAALFFQKFSRASRASRSGLQREARHSVDTPPYALRPSGSRIDAAVPGEDASTAYDKVTPRRSSLFDLSSQPGDTAEQELAYDTPAALTLGIHPTHKIEYTGDSSNTENGAPQGTHRHVINPLNPKICRPNMPKSDTSKPLPPLPQMDTSGNYGRRALEPLSRASHSNNSSETRPEPIYWRAEDRRQLWLAIIKSAHSVNDREEFVDIRNHLNKVGDSSERTLGATMVSPRRTELGASDDILTPVQLSVQELRQLVFVINQEWRKKLHSKPDLFDLCSSLPDQRLFDLGITTLQRFFEGRLANRFIDVFALSHIAMASAYLLHRDEELYPWEDLFEDIYLWRHTIVDGQDLLRFIEVMYTFGKSDLVAEGPGACCLSERSSADQLFETLSRGYLIEDCSSFLDSLDHVILPDSVGPLLTAFDSYDHATNIAGMMDQIIQPLKNQSGIEAFQPSVEYAEFQLSSWLLHNPHEVEVTLLSSGKRHSRSPQVYRRYRAAVKGLCDRVMEQKDGRWRNRYYVAALDKISLISVRIDQIRGRGSPFPDNWSNINIPDVQGSKRAADHWLIPSTPTARSSLPDWSPISTVSIISSGSSRRSAWSTNVISPNTEYSETASCSSAPQSPSPNFKEARCDLCNTTFKGSSRFSNLQRHLRSAKVHSGIAKLSCNRPGCKRKFTRSDNLSHHVQLAH